MPVADGDQPDSFTATICGQPVSGTAAVSANSNSREVCLTYTPTATFSGPTTVCVQVCDSYGNCTQTIIPITVIPESATQPTGQPPVVVVIPVVTPKNTTAQLCMPIVDPNVSDTHSVTVCGTPAKGSVSAVVNNTTHEVCITYTPNTGEKGNDSFCLRVCDQTGLCTQVTVPVTIVDPVVPTPGTPPVVVPPSIVTRPNEPVVVCTGISDTPTDSHTATVCGAPGLGGAQVGVNNTTHVLCVTYTPGSVPGSTSMCVQVCDQTGQCTQVIIPITILPTPCTLVAPTVQPSSTTICNTASLTLTATGSPGAVFTWSGPSLTAATGTSVTVLPAVSGLLSYTVTQTLNSCTSPPRVATVLSTSAVCLKAPVVIGQSQTTEKNNPVVACMPIIDTPTDTHNVTVCSQPAHGTVSAAVNNVTRQVCYTYTPATDYVGEDQVCLIVCDQTGLCDTVRVPITIVDPVNPPTGNPQIVVTPITLPQSTSTTVCTPVLKVSPTDQLTATICGGPQKGTATVAIVNGQLCITYNNTTGIPGSDTVCVTVCDQLNRCSSAVVPITITETQKPSKPILTNAPIVVKPGQTKQICLPYRDTESGTHTAAICSGPTKGTATVNAIELPKQVCVSYTPNPGVNNTTDQICVVLCNNRTNLCDTVRVPVTILSNPAQTPLAIDDINTTPINQPVPGNVLTNDLGYGLPLTATLLGQPTSGTVTLTSNGSYTYTPPTGFTGTVTFPYRACNTPTSCATALVTIKVLKENGPGNNKPVANNDNVRTFVNTPIDINVKANDSDPDNPATDNGTLADLPVQLTSPANGSVVLNTLTGKFIYTPAPNYQGNDSFKYSICDKGSPVLCDTAIVTIIIRPQGPNEPPIALDDQYFTNVNIPVSGSLGNNDTNPSNTTLTYTRQPVTAPVHGQVIINANGTFSYTPVAGYTGTDQFVYQVCNGAGCAQATAYIIVSPNPQACVTVNVKVLLEGPYNALTGRMNTILNQQGLLPGQRRTNTNFGVATPAGQPYNTAPWNYTGTEGTPVSFTYASTVVDWVLVSLRSSEQSPAAIWRAAGLLHDDGRITFVQPCFTLPTGSYYVVIEHRNHVGVMSPQSVAVTNNTISFDFTTQDSYIVLDPPSFGQIQIGNKWLMYAADGKKNTFNDNFDINSKDSQLWQSQSGQFLQYLFGDFNMDADVNAEDSVLWKKNNGRYSRVPH
ncbi:hypothetical protein BLX24_23130 [Arsenicibacter rosenii]|uniref:Tandem-95 repeat protein n=2 Tax=Arsenicibacter rosenii TaxID=1750698 RepID=A0A1S2VDL3_9BACT|nr:hypothetical protein BLX24_23130 [Arsenicibacter rosenii]